MFRALKNISKHIQLGRFNELAAERIDNIHQECPKHFLGKAFNFIEIRFIYLALFLPLTLVDMVLSGCAAISFTIRTFFTSDATQEAHLQKQKIYATLFSKNLYALAASALLIGLILPKVITLYFVPEKQDIQGVRAGGDYYTAPNAVLKIPESIEEIQDIIKEAVKNGKKIMPKGAGLSQGKQFLPAGTEELIIIDLKKIDTIEIRSQEKEAIIGAGATWANIKTRANEFKLAVKVMQASEIFSIGGSLGTNIHGWNIKDGMLSNVVRSITIVNAQGELQTLTHNDELFHNITGGLGLYSIIVSVTIKLTDNELLKEKGTEVTPAQYTHYFRNTVEKNPHIRMHLYRLSLDPENLLGSGVAVDYIKESNEAPVRDRNLHSEAIQGTRFERVMLNIAKYAGFLRRKYWESERNRLLNDTSPAMSINKIMQPPINALFNPAKSETRWLQEFFLPEEHLASFLSGLKDILTANTVNLINASVRFVKKNDKSPLSYAYEGDRFAVVICFNQSLTAENVIKAKKWIRKAQNLTTQYGGAYYLPYQHVSHPDDFKKAYPHVDEALAAKNKVDPDTLFVSGFYKKYMAPDAEKSNYFKEMMATPERKAKFSQFLKNVLYRIDTNAFFTVLKDVLQYCDTHEEIYTELKNRLAEIMPNTLLDLKRTLDSLASIKKELAAQAHSVLPADLQTINGLVEIGYPGRFVSGFKDHYKVTGAIVSVNEAELLTDFIQTGIPRPYDQFEKLDYAAPNLANLKDNSADVITCYVGLHHFKNEQLDNFLTDVRRVLRPNGHFLIVDHDVTDEETLCMAHMAHTVFNLITDVPLTHEMTETRIFRPMSYWKERLSAHGLGYAIEGADVPLIRAGDPTRNRMASFATPAAKIQQNTAKSTSTNKEWTKSNQSTFVRDNTHTFFSTQPENTDTPVLERQFAPNQPT